MKKFLSILMSIFLLLLSTFACFAANNVTFSVPSIETFAGDELMVDVFISDDSFLKSATISVHFDGSKLYFLDLYIGSIVPGGDNTLTYKKLGSGANSYIQIEYNDKSSSLSSAGKFVTLLFTAMDEAAGKSEIKLSVNSGAVTTKNSTVKPTFENGEINIINNTPVIPSSSVSSSEEPESMSDDVSQGNALTQSLTEAQQSAAVNNVVSAGAANEKVKNINSSKSTFIIITFIVLVVLAVLIFILNGALGKKNARKKKSRRGRK